MRRIYLWQKRLQKYSYPRHKLVTLVPKNGDEKVRKYPIIRNEDGQSPTRGVRDMNVITHILMNVGKRTLPTLGLQLLSENTAIQSQIALRTSGNDIQAMIKQHQQVDADVTRRVTIGTESQRRMDEVLGSRKQYWH